MLSLRWRLFFGPYPLLMMCTWAGKIGLIEDSRKAVSCLDRLRRAAVEGELDFYGQLITTSGVEYAARVRAGWKRKCIYL
ncbi:hypothetical protein IP86_17440 [Rhodopseudomonas sp. AAP120]|nr:hypothetical protein IP86_17440 [Rhodopseudomonas sp. AAP120]